MIFILVTKKSQYSSFFEVKIHQLILHWVVGVKAVGGPQQA